MKTSPISSKKRPRSSGFALVELTIVILIGLVVSGLMMSLMSQQIAFLRITRAQNFLIEEAPQINNTMTKLMSRADAFRIHNTFTGALNGSGAVTTGGSVLVLGFINPQTGQRDFGLVSLETDTNGNPYLGYYNQNQFGTPPTFGNPDWIISSRINNANFFVQNDVFRMTLTGPSGETITYSGTSRL